MDHPLPAYRGDEPYVFVCYAHADAGVVYPEMRALQQHGIQLWYDAGISGGAVWRVEIADALRGASRMLVYLSRASLASEHCQREIDYALDQGIAILPVYLEEVALPSGLDLSLGRVQALRRSAGEMHHADVLAALGRAVEPRPEKPRRRLIPYVAAASVIVLVGVAATFMDWRGEAPSAPTAAPDRSVSIAPFQVVGNTDVLAPLAESLTEQVNGLVSGYQQLRTVDYSNPPAASYLVRASVQAMGEETVVRPRLTRTADGETVWSDELKLTDAAADAQRHVARTIARFVRWQLVRDQECESIKRRTTNAEAARNLCAALALDMRQNQQGGIDVVRAGKLAERAMQLDPSLVESYALVAGGLLSGPIVERKGNVAKARAIIQRGLAVDRDEPTQLFFWAWTLLLDADLNYGRAESVLLRAIEIDPLHPKVHWSYAGLGRVAQCQGLLPEAIGWYRRAVAVFDGDAIIWREFAMVLALAGHWEQALAAADEGLALVTEGLDRAALVAIKAGALDALGRRDEAEHVITSAALEPELQFIPRLFVPDADVLEKWLATTDPSLANPSSLTLAYVALGRIDEAFDSVHRGIDLRDPVTIPAIRTAWYFDPLRRDPRWAEVMRHLEREEARGEYPVE